MRRQTGNVQPAAQGSGAAGGGLIRAHSGSERAALQEELAKTKRRLEEVLRENRELRESAKDSVTGLPTRSAYVEELRRAVEIYVRKHAAGDDGYSLVLTALDANGLKKANDTYGKSAGDMLLANIANAIRSVTRATDYWARIGGDEYMGILPILPVKLESRSAYGDGMLFERRLVQELRSRHLSAAVGIAAIDEHREIGGTGRKRWLPVYVPKDTSLFGYLKDFEYAYSEGGLAKTTIGAVIRAMGSAVNAWDVEAATTALEMIADRRMHHQKDTVYKAVRRK